MLLLYIKAFHVVGFVAWFAGLFYWLRIFVYHAEALGREEPAQSILLEQFGRMERRVYGIIVAPAAVFTVSCGTAMLVVNPAYLQQGWLQIKLVLIVALLAFQLYGKSLMVRLAAKPDAVAPERLRLLNEVPTVFLLCIVLLAVLRDGLSALAGIGILVVFVVGLGAGVRFYRGFRARNPEH